MDRERYCLPFFCLCLYKKKKLAETQRPKTWREKSAAQIMLFYFFNQHSFLCSNCDYCCKKHHFARINIYVFFMWCQAIPLMTLNVEVTIRPAKSPLRVAIGKFVFARRIQGNGELTPPSPQDIWDNTPAGWILSRPG